MTSLPTSPLNLTRPNMQTKSNQQAAPPSISSFLSSMIKLVSRLLVWLRSIFIRQEMELTVLGLQRAGKSTFVRALAGDASLDTMPTVGFSMRELRLGSVNVKVWDLGGERRFRGMWERYCRGVDALLYMVDAANEEKLLESAFTLQELLTRPQLRQIPLLVLGNKTDLPGALDETELIKRLKLREIREREVCCYMVSCKNHENLEVVFRWLLKHSKSA